MTRVYDSILWHDAREAALERDGSRCSVARLLGGRCSGTLHVHHIDPVSEGGAPFDVDNLGTTCASHHPQWEALRRALVGRRRPERRRCPHRHRTVEARLLCEARMARDQNGSRSVAA